jgi:uncharacterized protein (DUF362 family)
MKTQRKVMEPIVAITGGEGYEGDHLQAALDLLPVDQIIKREDVVVITPNWVNSDSPETGTVVGPKTLRRLIQIVKAHNPRRIVVAAGSGSMETPEVMKDVGFDRIINEEQVEFIDLNYGPYIDLPLNNAKPSSTKINQILQQLTVLISFAQLKTHSEATATMAIKSIALGWPPAEEHGHPKKNTGIHSDLHSFIAAMAEKIPIDLSIISTDKAMIGMGPSGGKPVAAGMIIAGTDPVSVDTTGARMLGYLPQAVHYLYTLIKRGVGEGDLRKVQFKGIPLAEAERMFSMAAYGIPLILDEKEIMSIDEMMI